MDIPDIQWKKVRSLRALTQQVGRAARGPDRVGEFIWFPSVWRKGERVNAAVARPGPSQLRQVMSINDTVGSETELDRRIDQVETFHWTNGGGQCRGDQLTPLSVD